MSDLDLAAAFAAGEAPPQAAFAPPGARRPPPPARRNGAQRIDAEMGGEPEGELPSIDDLEVAAAAAGVAPTPPMLTELGYELGPPPQAEPMQQDSSSDEEEGGSSGDEDGMGAAAPTIAAAGSVVRLELLPVGDESVAVRLHLLPAAADGVAADKEVASDSSYASSASSSASSSDDEAESSEAEGEPLDVISNYADLKKMIDDMDVADDEEGGGGGGGGGGAHRAEAELLGSTPLPSLAALEVKPDDAVTPAGAVQTMLEGMIVIQAKPGSRALSEGCVLVLEDRTPIGCIEEIFGPVMSPFYALRYGGGEPSPAALQAGAAVYSLDRLADFVLPEALRVRGYDAGLEEEEADLEAQFSDDEAEMEARRKLNAKRKDHPEGQQQGPGGRGGRGRGGRDSSGRSGGGRGGRGGRGVQQQQQAQFHPQQQQPQAPPAQPMQLPSGGRVFSGRLPQRQPPPPPGPPPGGPQYGGMMMQQAPAGYASYGAFYVPAGQPPPQQQASGVMRPQYAKPPPPPGQPPAPGGVMQAQYAGAPGMQPMQYGMQPMQQFTPAPPQFAAPYMASFRPQPPPPPYPPPQQQ